MYQRKDHMIFKIEKIETEGKTTTNVHALVFPSTNQAKRYNRTMLGGQAKVVYRNPKSDNYTSDNARCDRS